MRVTRAGRRRHVRGRLGIDEHGILQRYRPHGLCTGIGRRARYEDGHHRFHGVSIPSSPQCANRSVDGMRNLGASANRAETTKHPLAERTALTGNAAILAALQPPADHHRISQSPVVGTAFHRRPPHIRRWLCEVRVCRRQSAPCTQTIPKPSYLMPNYPCRNTFRRACPLGFLIVQSVTAQIENDAIVHWSLASSYHIHTFTASGHIHGSRRLNGRRAFSHSFLAGSCWSAGSVSICTSLPAFAPADTRREHASRPSSFPRRSSSPPAVA